MAAAYLLVSRWAFAFWWLVLLTLHTLAAGYNATYALFYLELDGTYLNIMLEDQSVGMPALYHLRIATAYAVIGALHGICLLLMIVGSLWHRALRFTVQPAWLTSWADSLGQCDCAHGENRLARAAMKAYYMIMDRDGLFGVGSVHFHWVIIIRELIETLLQTIQAYRMSEVLPRILVNRVFIILLVINCFAPMAVHWMFKRNEPRIRFANLLCDCCLDFAVSIGIPIQIALSYIQHYDPEIQGFPLEMWSNVEWTARLKNEFQLVLVVSWSDLFSRVVFSWGLLSTSTGMKELLVHSVSSSHIAIAPTATDVMASVIPQPRMITSRTARGGMTSIKVATSKKTKASTTVQLCIQPKFGHVIFVVWGLVIMGLHIHAEMHTALPDCQFQVRPWAHKLPLCYFIDLDCHLLGIEGLKPDMQAQWSLFDGSTVVNVLVRHCTALELPPAIQNFRNLHEIKIYNSTIVEWAPDAEVTAKHHPSLAQVYLVRVNLTDGAIPLGLLSRDFPATLSTFEIVVSNLRSLPDDLDQIWPLGLTVFIEFGNLTSVPLSLVRLQSYFLSVCGNPITELPPEMFESDNLNFLHIGRTLISELPHNVSKLSSSLFYFVMSHTNVSLLWSWIDPLVERSSIGGVIVAGGSPYCEALEHFWATGDASDFTTVSEADTTPSPYSVLMDPGQNAALIQAATLCEEEYTAPFYSLAFDDQRFALSAVELPAKPMN